MLIGKCSHEAEVEIDSRLWGRRDAQMPPETALTRLVNGWPVRARVIETRRDRSIHVRYKQRHTCLMNSKQSLLLYNLMLGCFIRTFTQTSSSNASLLQHIYRDALG